MFGAFLISVAAGYATPYARPTIEKFIEKTLLENVDIPDTQAMTLTFIACMLGASVLVVLFGSDAPAFVVVLGGGIGFFGKELYARVMKQVNK